MADQLTPYFGYGFAFPFSSSEVDGDVRGVSGKDIIRASILMYFSTRLGERVLQEDYGMPSILFESSDPGYLDSGLVDVIRNRWLNVFPLFEPRIVPLDVEVFSEDTTLRVKLRYRTRVTGEEDSLILSRTDNSAFGIDR